MLIRRNNWPAFLALAIFGPLLGAYLATELLPFEGCPMGDTEPEIQKVPVDHDRADERHHEAAEMLRLPDGDRIAADEIAPSRSVAVVVMKGPWCPVCQRQLERLSNQLQKVQSAGGSVVGLTAASPEKNRRLMDRLGLRFPVLSDASKEFHRKHGLWRRGDCHAIPGVVFLDESGDVAKVHRGRYPGQPQDEFVLETLHAIGR